MNTFLTRSISVLALIGVLVFVGIPTYRLATKLARAAIRAGWVNEVGERWKTPELFVIGCQINDQCKPVFDRQWNSSYDWRYAYGVLGAAFLTAFVFIITTKRRKQLYNARWARPSHLAGRTFKVGNTTLERGIQLAYLWKHYPDIHKNRYGHLQPLDWGTTEGALGGNVVAVVPRAKRKELGHVLIVGPTRCGKGLGLTENLLVYAGSAIVNDPKGENFNRTAALRASKGQNIRVIDPTGRGDRFDPFAELSVKPETLKMACKLIADPESDGGESIFAERGSSALYAAMRAALVLKVPILPYLREVTRGGLPGFVELLMRFPDDEVLQNLTDFLGKRPTDFKVEDAMQDRFLSSCWSTITARLFPLFSPGILASSAGSDFFAADLIHKPTSLYLLFSEGDLEFTKTYLQLVWLSIVSRLIEIGDKLDGNIPVPLILGLDEAGVVPVPRLPKLLATIAGRGMNAMIYVQDEMQLESAYGPEGAHTIKTNCDCQVYYAPRDEATQKNLSSRCGEMMLAQQNRTRSDGKLSMNWSSIKRTLIAPDETRMLHEENVIVFVANKPPLLGRRLNYLRHPLWKKAKLLPRIPIKDLTPHVLEAVNDASKPQAVPFPVSAGPNP